MVPEILPSGYTSILAPTRCGVEPCAATMVTSATSSPRSSALTSSVRTSCDIRVSYRMGRLSDGPAEAGPYVLLLEPQRPDSRGRLQAALKIIRSPIKDLLHPCRDADVLNRPQHEDIARGDAVGQADLRRHGHRARPPGPNQRDRARRFTREEHLKDGAEARACRFAVACLLERPSAGADGQDDVGHGGRAFLRDEKLRVPVGARSRALAKASEQ